MRLFAAIRSLLVAVLFVSLWAWLATAVRPYDSRLGGELPAWPAPLGWALAALGAPLVVACVAAFALRGRGTPAPFDPPRELVTAGPYRYVRNPMYVGAAALLSGAGLIVRSPSIVLLAVGFLVLAHVFVVLYEEPVLEETFGDGYRAYKRATGRWWPRLARSTDPGESLTDP